jgi:DNA-binding CsgD family transcriptional regulator
MMTIPLITLREKEVLRLIEEGLSTSQIAERLSLSVNTIETHRKKVYKKLGVGRVAEALKVAKNQGII